MTTGGTTARPLTAAVTGTNGKTSVAEFTRQILAVGGLRSASLGRLGLTVTGWGREPAPHIGDDAEAMPRFVRRLGEEGVDAVVFQAFSAALASGIHDRVPVDVAGWTNFSGGHLPEQHLHRYVANMLHLFAAVLEPGGSAVLNHDSAQYDAIAQVCGHRGIEVITYGSEGDIRARAARAVQGMDVELSAFGERFDVRLRLFAAFELANALCALGIAVRAGVDVSTGVAALSRLVPPPGRMVNVGERDGVLVVVDAARNPGALEAAIDALRRETPGRLILVMGCAGEGGQSTWSAMGRTAGRDAEVVIVTDDVPGYEEPGAIRAALLDACPVAREIADRREAIRAAIELADPDDTVLIAGRSVEESSSLAGGETPHSEIEFARRVLGGGTRSG